MKKRVYGKQLSRERDSRRALFRGLVWELVEHGKIKTTRTKAKAVQPMVDRLVVLAKKNQVADNRRVYAIMGNKSKVTKRFFEVIVPSLADRNSGFTKTINLGRRKGDMAEMVSLSWTNEIKEKEEKPKKETKKAKATNKATKTKETKKTTKKADKK